MRVKTFRGENMAAALSQIRQELGKEAVILGSQTVREDGRSLCEVMAALEHPGQPLPLRPGAATAGSATCPAKPGNGNGNGQSAHQAPRPPSRAKPGRLTGTGNGVRSKAICWRLCARAWTSQP
ncbi:hypothetical protein [Desulfovibrio sp. TomC]|uniref:hypothetical protein n=1 Tax=Desulfovibrio sp. TomC TaxID=1562888 RepID=UPI0005739C88|nr:hypothetical protein [Desulfovibrio sp. TomC]KHK04377.1 Flagellar biosynthesis protein FlhF [Desulfovibrio sp. TomC]